MKRGGAYTATRWENCSSPTDRPLSRPRTSTPTGRKLSIASDSDIRTAVSAGGRTFLGLTTVAPDVVMFQAIGVRALRLAHLYYLSMGPLSVLASLPSVRQVRQHCRGRQTRCTLKEAVCLGRLGAIASLAPCTLLARLEFSPF
jgi:hypothetical protein